MIKTRLEQTAAAPRALRRQQAFGHLLFAVLLIFAMGDLWAQPAADGEKAFLAGAATSNITPPLGLPIVGGWSPTPAEHVHDELHARCLVLDNGETRLVFAVCDNVGMPAEISVAAKKGIQERMGIPASHIMVSSTHTHSAVSAKSGNRMALDELTPYAQFIADRIVDGVQRAVNNLEPARIGWGSAQEPSSVNNRRWHMKPGDALRNPFGGMDKVRMNPPRASDQLIKPAGPTDPEVAFVSVQAADGRPLALLANYSLHYVGNTGSATVSADYFAAFARHIEQKLGAEHQDPPFVGIMTNGTSGDINNIDFTKSSPSLPPYKKIETVAGTVAQAVHGALDGVEYHTWVPLDARQHELMLKVRKPTPEILAYFDKVKNRPEGEDRYHQRELTYAGRIASLQEAPDEIPAVLHAFRIGDLAVCSIPFEVFVEIGLEIKEKSPFGQTFTASLTNGSYGYLPTVEHHALGGYETWMGTNNVEINAAPKIVRTLMGMLEELKQ